MKNNSRSEIGSYIILNKTGLSEKKGSPVFIGY